MSAQAQNSLLTKLNLNPRRRHVLTVLRSRSERHLSANVASGALVDGIDYTGMSYHGEFEVDARAAHLDAVSAEVVKEEAEVAAWAAEWLAQDEAEREAERELAAAFSEQDYAEESAFEVVVDLANMSDALDYEGWYGFHTFTPR